MAAGDDDAFGLVSARTPGLGEDTALVDTREDAAAAEEARTSPPIVENVAAGVKSAHASEEDEIKINTGEREHLGGQLDEQLKEVDADQTVDGGEVIIQQSPGGPVSSLSVENLKKRRKRKSGLNTGGTSIPPRDRSHSFSRASGPPRAGKDTQHTLTPLPRRRLAPRRSRPRVSPRTPTRPRPSIERNLAAAKPRVGPAFGVDSDARGGPRVVTRREGGARIGRPGAESGSKIAYQRSIYRVLPFEHSWLAGAGYDRLLLTTRRGFEKGDTRYTTVFFNGDEDIARLLSTVVLDYRTRPTKLGSLSYNEIIGETRATFSDAVIVITCNPCALETPFHARDEGSEMYKFHWYWLKSTVLCPVTGDCEENHSAKGDLIGAGHNCTLFGGSMKVINLIPSDINQTVKVTLLQMLLAVDDAARGVLNQDSVKKFRNKMDQQWELSTFQVTTAGNTTKLLVIGESIALRLGMFWQDYIDIDLLRLAKSVELAPHLDVLNLAQPGITINRFICLVRGVSDAYDACYKDREGRQELDTMLHAMRDARPHSIIIHDQYWALWPKFLSAPAQFHRGEKKESLLLQNDDEKVLAMHSLLLEAAKNQIQSVFFLTQSPQNFRIPKTNSTYPYTYEMKLIQTLVHSIECREPSNERQHVFLNIVDWTKLVCPDITKNGSCKRNMYNFSDILPDGVHPSGPSGLSLSRWILSLIYETIQLQDPRQRLRIVTEHLRGLTAPFSPSTIVTSLRLCPEAAMRVLEHNVKQAMKRNLTALNTSQPFQGRGP